MLAEESKEPQAEDRQAPPPQKALLGPNKGRQLLTTPGKILSAICVVCNEAREVLLVKRHPYDRAFDGYCFPGGKVNMSEDPQEAATRELKEETGIHGVVVRQLGEYLTEKTSVEPETAGKRISREYLIVAYEVAATDLTLREFPTAELEGAVWVQPEHALASFPLAGPTTRRVLELFATSSSGIAERPKCGSPPG